MRTSTIARRAAAGLLATAALTACGIGSQSGNPQAGGDVFDGTQPGGDSLALPVRATYGYLDLTVTNVETRDTAPEDIRKEEPATYVSVDLSIENPVDGYSYTLPGGMFAFTSGGDEYRGANENNASEDNNWSPDIQVKPGPNATSNATVWFTLPADETITSPTLTIRDSGYEPLSIPLTGEAVAPESVPLSMDRNYKTACEKIKFGEAFASFNNRLTDDGEALPAPGVSSLGRAAENQVLVSFDANATEFCDGLGTFFSVEYGAYAVLKIAEVDGDGVEVEDNVGQPDNDGVDGVIAFAVPADATAPLEITWWNYRTDPTSTISTSASLDQIAELTAK